MHHVDSVHNAHPSRSLLVAGLLALALVGLAGCGGPGAGGQGQDGGAVGKDGGVSDGGATGRDGGIPDGGNPGQDGGVTDGGSGNCAGTVESLFIDQDGDGYTAGKKDVCVTGAIPPGYTKTSKGQDCNDLDGRVMVPVTAYRDADGDGYGTGSPQTICVPASKVLPPHYAAKGGDCDDSDPAVHPGLPEIPDDGLDNDCAGGDSTAASLPNVLYVDASVPGPGGGTAANPYSSLDAAVAAATKGTVIVLAQGQYTTSSSTSFDGKTVVLEGGYDAGTPWKRNGGPGTTTIGTTAGQTISANGGDLTLDNLTVIGPQVTNVGMDVFSGVSVQKGNLVAIDVVVKQVMNSESATDATTWGIDASNETLELIRTTITGNAAQTTGSSTFAVASIGVRAAGVTARIVKSHISGGSAVASGATAFATAVFLANGSLTMYGSTLDSTSAIGVLSAGSKVPLQARGVTTQDARVLLAGNTFDTLQAQTDHDGFYADARAVDLTGGSSQVVDNTVKSVAAINNAGSSQSYGIALQGQTSSWVDHNRVLSVHALAKEGSAACRADTNGIGILGVSNVLLQRNLVGSGWLDVYPSNLGCSGAADGLLVKGSGNVVVAGGNVFAGQSVTSDLPGSATLIGRGMVFVGSAQGVFMGDTFVAGNVTAPAPASALAQTIMVDGNTRVLIADSAIVSGTGATENVGLRRQNGGTVHLYDDAFVNEAQAFTALVAQGTNSYPLLGDVDNCAKWKTGCGSATGHNILSNDPFVRAAGGLAVEDYHLRPKTELVDAVGDPTRVDLRALSFPSHLGVAFWDFDGDQRPQGPAWDIGADERVP